MAEASYTRFTERVTEAQKRKGSAQMHLGGKWMDLGTFRGSVPRLPAHRPQAPSGVGGLPREWEGSGLHCGLWSLGSEGGRDLGLRQNRITLSLQQPARAIAPTAVCNSLGSAL